jgi:hypothetical protein
VPTPPLRQGLIGAAFRQGAVALNRPVPSASDAE